MVTQEAASLPAVPHFWNWDQPETLDLGFGIRFPNPSTWAGVCQKLVCAVSSTSLPDDLGGDGVKYWGFALCWWWWCVILPAGECWGFFPPLSLCARKNSILFLK